MSSCPTVRRERGALSPSVGALPQVGELRAGAVAGAALDGARNGEAWPLLLPAGAGEGASGGIECAENRWGGGRYSTGMS